MSDDETAEHHSRKDRLKDAFFRTRNKIEKHAAERIEKHAEHRRKRKEEEDIAPVNNDVDDFLAAGRTSTSTSQRKQEGNNVRTDNNVNDFLTAGRSSASISRRNQDENGLSRHNDIDNFLAAGRTSSSVHRPSNDSSIYHETSSRPSTSDSANVMPQISPRRVPIPRLDVSGSQRFPNARMHGEQQYVTADGDRLRPDLYPRSQSASAASLSRKERIRGLSVGFVTDAPVIIGEGGDEAEAPPVEIGRAKARSRSMSPMGAKPSVKYVQNLSPVQQSARSPHVPDEMAMWEPKPFRRVGTGALAPNAEQNVQQPPPSNFRNGTPVQETDFVPKSMRRNPTRLDKEFEMTLPKGDGTLGNISAPPASTAHKPINLMGLDKEFQMTLPKTDTRVGNMVAVSAMPSHQVVNPTGLEKEFQMTLPKGDGTTAGVMGTSAMPLHQPKPKRPAPSYNAIETGPPPTISSPPPAPVQQHRMPEPISGYTQSPIRTGPPSSEHLLREPTLPDLGQLQQQSNARVVPQQLHTNNQLKPSMADPKAQEPARRSIYESDSDDPDVQLGYHPYDVPEFPYIQRSDTYESTTMSATLQTPRSSFPASSQPLNDPRSIQDRNGADAQQLYSDQQQQPINRSQQTHPQALEPPQPDPAIYHDHKASTTRKPVPSPERNPYPQPEQNPNILRRQPIRSSSSTQKTTIRSVPPRRQNTFSGEQETGVVSALGRPIPVSTDEPTSDSYAIPPRQHALRRKQDVSQLRKPQQYTPQDFQNNDLYEQGYDAHKSMVSGVPVTSMAPAGIPGQRFYDPSGDGTEPMIRSGKNPPEGFI